LSCESSPFNLISNLKVILQRPNDFQFGNKENFRNPAAIDLIAHRAQQALYAARFAELIELVARQ